METTLRAFYWRAIPLLLFFIAVMFLLALTMVGVAFAQDLPPLSAEQIAPPENYTGVAGVANTGLAGLASGLALALVTLIVRVWNMLPVWLSANIDMKKTMDSLHWRENIREAAYDGLIHAATQLKIDPKSIQTWEEKSAFLTLAGQFISRFDGEIKEFFDKDKDGVPDIIQVALAKIAPQTVTITPPTPSQGFMSVPPPEPRVRPRVSDEVLERLSAKQMAAKIMKRPKGVVSN